MIFSLRSPHKTLLLFPLGSARRRAEFEAARAFRGRTNEDGERIEKIKEKLVGKSARVVVSGTGASRCSRDRNGVGRVSSFLRWVDVETSKKTRKN